ncbi:hypothetical protein EJB05_18382, partial [Eragrostis curvula]
MHPPSPKPIEAATVARRGGLLAQARSGIRARARTRGHGVGFGYSAPSPARRRLQLVASLGVMESAPALQPLGEEEAVAAEVDKEDAADSARILPPPDGTNSDPTRVFMPQNTVRVKFVLQKKCAFGQQFLVVGDDPALGLWDPTKAAALDWSEGDVWTVNTDLPANRLIEFKFLLRDATGHVRWQHGDNRSLQTTETQNTLVVHEDWDHAMNQRVSEEEEELAVAAEDVTTFSDELAGSNGALLSDDPQAGENLESNGSVVVLADVSPHEEMKGANEENQQQFILEKDQKLVDEIHRKAGTALQNGHPAADDSAQQEDMSTSIFENDLAWARKALQQLLRFLGFQIGTTRT